jgi:sialic acid synthase SpsE
MAKKNGTNGKAGSSSNGHIDISSMFSDPFNVPTVEFANRQLSSVHPALIVAEIGLNHCGQVDRALRLIEAAAEAGADAVKFQKRDPRQLLTSEAYNQPYFNSGNSFGLTYGEHREALEFDIEVYKDLRAAASELGVQFFASVWDINSLEDMIALNIPAIKIPSPDLTDEPLLTVAAQSGIPIFISTGMSKIEEIDRSVELLTKYNAPFVLFHCISIYPTPADQARLATIRHFSSRYKVPVGYSGHEMEPTIAVAARCLGACVIEKHFTMDRSWKGGDQAISLLPQELARITEDVRAIEKGLFDVRNGYVPGELQTRKKLAKSIIARRYIAAGEILTPDLIDCKSPGGGLSPQNIHRLMGRRVKWEISPEQYILESHLEESADEQGQAPFISNGDEDLLEQ